MDCVGGRGAEGGGEAGEEGCVGGLGGICGCGHGVDWDWDVVDGIFSGDGEAFGEVEGVAECWGWTWFWGCFC